MLSLQFRLCQAYPPKLDGWTWMIRDMQFHFILDCRLKHENVLLMLMLPLKRG